LQCPGAARQPAGGAGLVALCGLWQQAAGGPSCMLPTACAELSLLGHLIGLA
jgi:hypothetical protein